MRWMRLGSVVIGKRADLIGGNDVGDVGCRLLLVERALVRVEDQRRADAVTVAWTRGADGGIDASPGRPDLHVENHDPAGRDGDGGCGHRESRDESIRPVEQGARFIDDRQRARHPAIADPHRGCGIDGAGLLLRLTTTHHHARAERTRQINKYDPAGHEYCIAEFSE